MTRKQLLRMWCAAEGGKKSALDAPQSREAYAKLRRIIAENFGVDLDDIIREKDVAEIFTDRGAGIAYRYLPMGPNGVHLLPKPARTRKPVRKPAKRRAGK